MNFYNKDLGHTLCIKMAVEEMGSNVLLIGSGGREHAIVWLLSKSPNVKKVFVAPGNAGTCSGKGVNVDMNMHDFEQLKKFALDNEVKLVIAGPEQPLVDGITDEFKKVGIPCFGPSRCAARIEGSKSFSKDFMKRHGIPTAEYQSFNDYELAKKYALQCKGKIVIKASGLAAGKGVILPDSKEEIIAALHSIMNDLAFGQAGNEVIIEERLEGQEVSVLAFSDGYTIVPFPGAQDHKRVFNHDLGPNTGGMGAYAPAPIYTPSLQQFAYDKVLKPTIDGMRREGSPFIGILYAGLMLTASGPKVLEYNCRFGDPETQVLLPLLDATSDLFGIFMACVEGRLDSVHVAFKKGFAATIVAASAGYPGSYAHGNEICTAEFASSAFVQTRQIPGISIDAEVILFHAGTKRNGEKVQTSGGRVLAVTAYASSLEKALELANDHIAKIRFDGMHYRNDIGHRAISAVSPPKTAGLSYAAAGVDIDAGNRLVEAIKPLVKATRRAGADAELGGFGGLFDLKAAGFRDPLLVSGTDGVGTKLKIAQFMGKHDSIGIDLVAMCVNDVLAQGAEPLYFLDYFACSKLQVSVAEQVVAGIAFACKESGCALIGGETAEMPGIYSPDEYDLAGFVVGAVEREHVLPRLHEIGPGDVVLGLASSGVHSNGFSLVRHVVKTLGLDFASRCPFDSSKSLGEALLTPTKLYVKPLLPVLKRGLVKSLAHITGGGFTDNIPRALPSDMGVLLKHNSWKELNVFKWLKEAGNLSDAEMLRTFNCGVGMVLIVDQAHVGEVVRLLKDHGEQDVFELGMVIHQASIRGNQVSFV